MNDGNILKHISQLVDDEQRLRQANAEEDPDGRRLRDVEYQLDQCWDLLRQRRALREFGRNPDNAEVRDAGTVEGYSG